MAEWRYNTAQTNFPEELKKCITIAESFYKEAKISNDVKQTGALLASNCQKVFIGPSFHLYASKNEILRMLKSQEDHSLNEEQVSDDEEYETVIYNGPNEPIICLSDSQNAEEVLKLNENAHINLKRMNVKLAQASAQYGGLLSPDFFCSSSGVSSASSKEGSSSSETPSPASTQQVSSMSVRNAKMQQPFSFPKVSTTETRRTDQLADIRNDTPQELERVEIIDDASDEYDETKLEEFPKKFIEKDGFRLGIQPGSFYRSTAGPFIYVKLPHRSKYEIIVTNSNSVACDVDLYVNGRPTFALRLSAGDSRSIDGPQLSENAFKLFRASETPQHLGVREGNPQHGTVSAKFTPQKIETARMRTASEPPREFPYCDILDTLNDPAEERKTRSYTTNDKDNVERSIDLSQVMEGVTLLQGKKKKCNYVHAPKMETDVSKRVILQLRLVASATEEVESSNEEVYYLEPPPVPSRKKS